MWLNKEVLHLLPARSRCRTKVWVFDCCFFSSEAWNGFQPISSGTVREWPCHRPPEPLGPGRWVFRLQAPAANAPWGAVTSPESGQWCPDEFQWLLIGRQSRFCPCRKMAEVQNWVGVSWRSGKKEDKFSCRVWVARWQTHTSQLIAEMSQTLSTMKQGTARPNLLQPRKEGGRKDAEWVEGVENTLQLFLAHSDSLIYPLSSRNRPQTTTSATCLSTPKLSVHSPARMLT